MHRSQGGDIVVRLKENGAGLHYGRLAETMHVIPPEQLGGGYFPRLVVSHTTPEDGKHVGTLEEFFKGLPGGWVPQDFTDEKRRLVEQASVSDVGKPYSVMDTCEDDVLGFSPTRNDVFGKVLLVGLGGVLLGAALSDKPKARSRRPVRRRARGR